MVSGGALRTHVGVVVDVQVPGTRDGRVGAEVMVDRDEVCDAHVIVDTTSQYEARADEEITDDMTQQRRRRGRQDLDVVVVIPTPASAPSATFRTLDPTIRVGDIAYAVDATAVSSDSGGIARPVVGRVLAMRNGGGEVVVSMSSTATARDVEASTTSALPTGRSTGSYTTARPCRLRNIIVSSGTGFVYVWDSSGLVTDSQPPHITLRVDGPTTALYDDIPLREGLVVATSPGVQAHYIYE